MSMETTPTFDQQEFGRRVRQVREAKAMTQPQLARAAGVCRATVARVESGQGDCITLVSFWLLLRALDTTPNALLGVDDTERLTS